VRSFGSDPALVARHVAAAVRGLQGQGVAACVKHFPGHGDTRADSHHELPTLTRSREDLAQVELPPFAAAISAGARAVMTGHLLVPSLDAQQLATVSPLITRALLRDELGFTGTVVTDAIEMRALRDRFGLAGGYVAALAAGADAVETGAQDYPYLLDEIPEAVATALDEGVLSHDRLVDAAARTAALATPGQALTVDLPDGLAARCIEVDGRLPALQRPLVVEARPPANMASGELPWSLAEPLSARINGVEFLCVHEETPVDADGRSLVVVVRDPHRHLWQHALIEQAAAHPSAAVVDVGWPADLPAELPVVRTRGVAPGLLAAAASALANAR
jgi:beta-N-acetylhexosaminidase